jgi:hypothetical protein
VHLRSDLPEVVAIGTDALSEMIRGVWPLGGPHCEVRTLPAPSRFNVVTPECEFTYGHLRTERDTAGWYFLFKLVYTSVLGSFSYDTQIGGETTVPQLTIASIKVTGSVK